jgi:hypothetical protein
MAWLSKPHLTALVQNLVFQQHAKFRQHCQLLSAELVVLDRTVMPLTVTTLSIYSSHY